MERDFRLRKNSDFTKVYKRGKAYWNKHFTVSIKKNGTVKTRVGFSVSKKVGNAVERNKIKRKLREIIRLNRHSLEGGCDIVITPRKNTLEMEYKQIENSLMKLLSNIHKKRALKNE